MVLKLALKELANARDTIIEKRKRKHILDAQVTADFTVKAYDMVQVYLHTGKEKWGKWLSARIPLSADIKAGTVTAAHNNGCNFIPVIEDTRLVLVDDDFAAAAFYSSDDIEDSISKFVDSAHILH